MKRPTAPSYDLEALKRLMRAFRRYDLSELEIRQGDATIVLRRNHTASRAPAEPRVEPAHEPAFPLPTAGKGEARFMSTVPEPVDEDADAVYITSPLVGTFYRAPSPGAKAFVETGSAVQEATTVCIIEAMKLMNEIPAEVRGTITDVLVENGKAVEFGERLFRVRRSG